MSDVTPILLLGAGRMGGAMIEGWVKAGAFGVSDMIAVDPQASQALKASGVTVNPIESELARAKTVVLAVKPQMWKAAAAQYGSLLAPDAVIVSIAAGVTAADISAAFGDRAVARIMPTTAVAIGKGTASIYGATGAARARAHALFDPISTTADLDDEGLLHAATGVSGSAPAYLYAFIEALEAAGVAAGLTPEVAGALSRSTIAGSAMLLDQSGEDPAELRRQVTSPGGTTAEALKVLMGEHGLGPLLDEAVSACIRRSRELAAG
jgi:pyrroline-5-carboxylate reductase